ncbi:hypothetical protein [Parabacteroides sp. FAFU027]|uniref:hypothetical protein n=1 Tax=Parabacteroides sp. FAFU027 TaxID=2922715 RepID=UPI001FAFAB8B|nr:hypothetical protein [Parabacteroides sp. FAFU027]
MNKSFLVIFLVIIFCHISDLNAQFARRYNGINYWFVGAGTGTSLYMGENDRSVPGGISKLLQPNLNLQVGYWFNQTWGIRMKLDGFHLKGWDCIGKNPDGTWNLHDYYHSYYQDMRYLETHVDLFVNPLSFYDDFAYETNWNWSLYTGLGLAKVSSKETEYIKIPSAFYGTVKGGTVVSYLVSDQFSVFSDLSATILPQSFDGMSAGKRKFDTSFTLSFGVIYQLPEFY